MNVKLLRIRERDGRGLCGRSLRKYLGYTKKRQKMLYKVEIGKDSKLLLPQYELNKS